MGLFKQQIPQQTLFAAGVRLAMLLAVSHSAVSAEVPANNALVFDNDFLAVSDGAHAKQINLAYFSHVGGMMPGTYSVQVNVNQQMVANNVSVTFKALPNTPWKLYACVPIGQFAQWGIAIKSALQKKVAGSCAIGGVSTLIPYAHEKLDLTTHQLNYTVPQADLLPPSVLRTPPTAWQSGVTALMLNYSANAVNNNTATNQQNSYFFSTDNQLNWLDWRIKSNAAWYKNSHQNGHWNIQNIYGQHDYSRLYGGQLTIGQTTTDGSIINSVPFVGVMAQSDNSMLRQDFSHYSPTVAGIAHSNATVTISQQGNVIYQTSVPAGPFSLKDFNANSAQDIDVAIKESNGEIRHINLAATTAPNLVRQGGVNYSVALGRYQQGTGMVAPQFMQSNIAWGATSNTTLLGGDLLSQDYQAIALGIGQYSAWFGGLSYLYSLAMTNVNDSNQLQKHYQGQYHQLTWTRNIAQMAVNVSLDYYSRARFYSFSDIQSYQSSAQDSNQDNYVHARYKVSLAQPLGRYGSLSLSGSRESYWDSSDVGQNWLISYNSVVGRVSLGIAAGYNVYPNSDGSQTHDKSLAISLSLPLGDVNANYLFSSYGHQQMNHQLGINGNLADNKMNYALSQSWASHQAGDNAAQWQQSQSVNLNYNGDWATVGAAYSHSPQYNNTSANLRGGLLIHPHGVIFSQPLSLDGGSALVDLGVANVPVLSSTTNSQGYAVVSGLIPYDRNKIAVDVSGLPGDVDVSQTTQTVIPRKGALVAVHFAAQKGYRFLLSLTDKNHQPLPFGSIAHLVNDNINTGIVGDSGQVYLSGLSADGTVLVSWGKDKQCQAHFQVPAGTDAMRVNRMSLTCQ